ncbi:hypothetical protein [Candidatus Aalborgicola defluviihabitans]|jgi:hypothetical protein|uniref:hypothetical protein n=2 Tax=Candidatus Aalborgicola defluviihabitans TaxID=3386187 RepID=UPI001ED3D109|nr:hypothetical protein [Burkholderiales bacterium]
MQMAWILVAFLVGVSAAAGAVYALTAKRRQPKEAPDVWPVTARPLTSFGERRTWAWLAHTMPEQQIAPKVPLARFTHPGTGPDAAHWFKRLNGIYCTFTVLSVDGRVLGCVDVENDKWPTQASQDTKYNVLTQLDIPYRLVDPKQLPDPAALRAEFLREPAVDTSAYARLQEEYTARNTLDAIFEEKRQTRADALDSFPTDKNRRARHKEHQLQPVQPTAAANESAPVRSTVRAS